VIATVSSVMAAAVRERLKGLLNPLGRASHFRVRGSRSAIGEVHSDDAVILHDQDAFAFQHLAALSLGKPTGPEETNRRTGVASFAEIVFEKTCK
jgi:hypothetical protein